MQTPVDPLDAAALDAALQPGQERYFRQTLEIDWDRDGLFAHTYSDLSAIEPQVKLAEELDDSTPGSHVVASGAAAGELTVTMEGSLLVAGDYLPASELFSLYNTASPLYGTHLTDLPIRWTVHTWTARGWISTVQFTGWIDERSVQRGANRVTLTAINIPPKLRDPVHWPLWAVDGPAAARIQSHAPQRGLASSVVDYILNTAGLRTRPRPPWESDPDEAVALCWLPLCGSFAPAAGRMLSQHPWGNFQFFPATYPISPGWHPQGTYWVDGPFGTARHGEANIYPGALIYTTRDQQPTWDGHSTSVSAWIWCGPDADGYDPSPSATLRPQVVALHFGFAITTDYYAYRLSIATAGPTLQIQVENGTSTLRYGTYTPATTAWRHVHAQLDHTTGSVVRGKLIVDGVTEVDFTGSTGSTTTAPALNVLFLPQVGFHLRPGVPLSDAMAWQQTGAPTIVPERAVTAGAEVDRSLNEITHLPPPGDSGWETVKEIAAAEYAAIHIHSDGHFHFHNRDNVRWSTTQTTLTLSVPEEVGLVDSEDGHANAVQVSAQPGEASWQKAWELPSVDAIVAPPGVTEWIFPLDDDVIAIESGTVPALFQSAESASALPVWSGSVNSGYVFVYDGTETEELLDQNMVNLTDQSGLGDQQLMRIVVTNSSTSNGRFRLKDDTTAGTDPQPALRIAGLVLARPPVQTGTVTSAENVTADGQQRTIALTGGEWRQHLPSVEDTARFALRRTTQQIGIFDRFQTPGDPRRELSDPYLLTLGATGPRVHGFATAITRSYTGGRLTDDLTIRATHGPGRWVLDDEVLGVLETTAIVG